MKKNATLLNIIALSLCLPVMTNAIELAPPAPLVVKCPDHYPTFEVWKNGVRKEALTDGITMATWEVADPLLTNDDPAIVNADRKQGGFYKSFLDFSLPRTTPRLKKAREQLKQYTDVFAQIEEKYGVPGQVIVAFWGMETDFATKPNPNTKLYPVLETMATLAYDCRRPDFFRGQLFDALRLIQNNDVNANDYKGEGAGEVSGLQFTPTNYFKYGVAFDPSKKRDPEHNVADMLASAANVLKDYGWRAGEPFLQEVSA